MKTESLILQHERVDDVPLLVGFVQRLQLADILERHLGSHHLHQGLSNGTLAATWIAFLLSQASHCKVSVQGWAQRLQHTLETLLGQPVRPVEFSDDRLSILLRRLHDADWDALEAELWHSTCQVYELPIDCIRLDATTSYGYHEVHEGGVLQFGHSKDHRPDLPQLKLMAAVAQPTSQLVACDLVPGNHADDPLYLPLITRVRKQLGKRGLLYAGDCKMAALETRADIAGHGDYYLMPLPRTGETALQWDGWIDDVLAHPEQQQQLQRVNAADEVEVFARGLEWTRECRGRVEEREVVWTERVQIVQPLALAERQAKQLEQRLERATQELFALTPPVGPGRRQFSEEEPLRAALAEVLERQQVTGLLEVQWRREVEVTESYAGRGRGGPKRKKVRTEKVRYGVAEVKRQVRAINAAKERLGWRVQVTNLSAKRCDLEAGVLLYNGGWSVERDFHLLKDLPLGIQPLYVREEEQIVGLTRLLTIALRVLTLLEVVLRGALVEKEESLAGFYEGQANRKTQQPTASRLLKAITRMEITVSRVVGEEESAWYLTPLPKLLRRILGLLKLSPKLYTRLATDTG
jgi:transposase